MKKKAAATKDLQALRSLAGDDLRKELEKARKELYLLSMKHQANELKQPHLLKAARKQIAQLEMLIIAA